MDRKEFAFFIGINAVVLLLMLAWFCIFSSGCGGNFDGENIMISDLSGQLNLSDPRKIPDGDYAIGRNIERLDGILQSRRGISKVNPSNQLGSGIAAYFNNGAHGYVQAGTGIYRTDTWASIYTLTSSAKLRAIPYKSYTQTDNELFLTNGTDYVRIGSDRTASKWGISGPSVSSSSGSYFCSPAVNGDIAKSGDYSNGHMVMVGTDIFLADYSSHCIRKIASDGTVTVFAGVLGSSGSTDGTGSAARFYYPKGISAIGTDLYVTDAYNHTIRKITSGAVVTTIAGSAGTSGTADGTGTAARLYYPFGITTDGVDLYICDYVNHSIRKCTTAGVVTTFAGLSGTPGEADGTGTAARFYNPEGITYLSTIFYVSDFANHIIRKITAAGVVTTIAGDVSGKYPGYVDGTGTAARFNLPRDITNDGTNIIVSDQNRGLYRVVTTAGVVTTWPVEPPEGPAGHVLYSGGVYYVHDLIGVSYSSTKLYKYRVFTLTASGTGLTGNYWVAIAYARKVGNSVAHVGNPSNSVQITGLSNQGIQITGIPDPSNASDPDYDTQVTHIFIYRSRANGGQYQLYKDVEIEVGTTSAILTQGDIYLGADIEFDNDLPPSGGTVIGRPDNQGYMFAAVGNKVYYCKARRPEAWPPSQFFEVGSPQWPVLAILYGKGSTILKTKWANHLLQGSGKSFVAIPFPVNDGAVATDACLSDEGTHWHLGEKGIYEMSGLGGQELKITNGILDALWNGTASNGDSIKTAAITYSQIARAGDRIYLLYVGENDAGLSRILVIDTAKKKFLGIWQFPAAVVSGCLAFDEVNEALYMGASNGYLYQLESGTTDDGTAITYKIRSKDLYSGKYFPVSYGRADVYVPTNGTGPTVTLYADGTAAVTTGAISSRDSTRVIPVNGESAMAWSIELNGSADSNGAHKFYALEIVP